MRKIDDQPLWIGTAADARDARLLSDAEIAAVVDLALSESAVLAPRELAYLRFPLVDGAGNPRWLVLAAIRAVAEFVRAGVPTLVACGAGMSRSPCIVAAALAMVEQGPAEIMLRRICQNAKADVSPAFWSDVAQAMREG
jgi:protein-tyrosine phosphatase